jgi:hypothetical protein
MVGYAVGAPVPLMCGANAGFLMRAEQLEAAITPRKSPVAIDDVGELRSRCPGESADLRATNRSAI